LNPASVRIYSDYQGHLKGKIHPELVSGLRRRFVLSAFQAARTFGVEPHHGCGRHRDRLLVDLPGFINNLRLHTFCTGAVLARSPPASTGQIMNSLSSPLAAMAERFGIGGNHFTHTMRRKRGP